MGHTEVTENDVKDTLHDKRQKKIKYKKPPHKKIRKTQNESTGSSKNGENHI